MLWRCRGNGDITPCICDLSTRCSWVVTTTWRHLCYSWGKCVWYPLNRRLHGHNHTVPITCAVCNGPSLDIGLIWILCQTNNNLQLKGKRAFRVVTISAAVFWIMTHLKCCDLLHNDTSKMLWSSGWRCLQNAVVFWIMAPLKCCGLLDNDASKILWSSG